MKANLFVVASLLAGCAVEADTDVVAQGVSAQTILLPASGTGQSRVVMNAFEPLAVVLYDTYGNPLVGETIRFTAPAGGATSSLETGLAQTDAEGRAELRPTANRRSGTYLVWAHADGADAMPFVLTNQADAPAQVLPVLGRNQAAHAGMVFELPLTVEVQDFFGNRVPDASVEFIAPTDGATARMLDEGVTTTDEEGRASTFAVAGEKPGTYSVKASVEGLETSFVLENMDNLAWRTKLAHDSMPAFVEPLLAP
jgi:hypothetical protein